MYRTKVRFTLCLMLIWWVVAVAPASAQHFKQIPGSLDHVSAGRAEVWGILCTKVYCIDSEVYRFDSSTHTFVKISGTPQGLVSIAVGGGSALQSDEVWGLDGINNNVYRFNFTKNEFVKVPGSLFQIAVGEGDGDKCHPYEVWGIFGPNVADPGTFRYNYCTSKFDQIQTANSGLGTPSPFAQIAVSANDVWGIDESSCLWHLVGVSGTEGFWSAGDYSGGGGCDYLPRC